MHKDIFRSSAQIWSHRMGTGPARQKISIWLPLRMTNFSIPKSPTKVAPLTPHTLSTPILGLISRRNSSCNASRSLKGPPNLRFCVSYHASLIGPKPSDQGLTMQTLKLVR